MGIRGLALFLGLGDWAPPNEEQRTEGTRNPRPFTGFFFGLYMHPNKLIDLKIVFNQHPKPPNSITYVFCFGFVKLSLFPS